MVAIVTGASTGLGLEIARLLEARGTAVVGVSRRGGTTVRGDASQRETALRAVAAAEVGKPNETVYCAAKWGARGYSEALRAEAKGTKLRVMTAAPGGMNTPFWPQPRPDFMDPREVASVIVDAIHRKVNVYEIVIV